MDEFVEKELISVRKNYKQFIDCDGDLATMIAKAKPDSSVLYHKYDNDTSYKDLVSSVAVETGYYLQCLQKIVSWIKAEQERLRLAYNTAWNGYASGSLCHPKREHWREFCEEYRKHTPKEEWGIDFKTDDEVVTNTDSEYYSGVVVKTTPVQILVQLSPVDKRRKKKEVTFLRTDLSVCPAKFSTIKEKGTQHVQEKK